MLVDNVVKLANELLVRTGLSAVDLPVEELKAEINRGSSSMFVGLFEATYKVRLEGIIRQPTKEGDYISNAHLVIDALKHYCQQSDVVHIAPVAIAKSNLEAVYDLLRIFKDLQPQASNLVPGE